MQNLKNKLILFLFISLIIFTMSGCETTVIIDEIKTTIEDYKIHDDNKIQDTQITIPDTPIEITQENNKLDIIDKEVENHTNNQNVTNENHFNYYKQKLVDENEKELYEHIYNGLNNLDKKFSIPISNSEQILKIYEFVKLDNPQLFYCPTTFKILSTKINGTVSAMELSLDYNTWDKENIEKAQQKINEEIEDVITQLNNIDGDYNKILYLYSFLAQNIAYQNNEDSDYNIYGALVKKKATCEGFSESFQYILNKINIDAISVVGESKDQPHEWNMAKIDGQWYYFDVTWDSPTNTSKYLPYNYFAITTDSISLTHDISYLDLLPEANNTKYNYYNYNDLILYSYSESELIKLSKNSHEINPYHITFKTMNNDVYQKVINNIKDWLPKALKELGMSKSEVYYMSNNKLNIIDIYLKED